MTYCTITHLNHMTTMSLVQVTIEPTHNSFTYIKQLTKQRHTEAFAMCLYTCPSLSLMYIHLKQSINHFQQQQSLHKHTYTQTHTHTHTHTHKHTYTHTHCPFPSFNIMTIHINTQGKQIYLIFGCLHHKYIG